VASDRAGVIDRPRTAAQSRGTGQPRQQRSRRTWRRWINIALGGAILLVIGALANVLLLFYADFASAGNGSSDAGERARWAWERGDHLHYAGHLVLGRIFDLCPCSRNAAGAQYYYAKFHAVTPQQRAVVLNTKPSGAAELAHYFTGPVMVWFEWIGDGIAWLGGQRPPTRVLLELDQYAVTPETIRIARGTTVIWRNVDELGEAHTVTAAPQQAVSFDSGWLAPTEQFQFTFTERGQFVFYCREHGKPIPSGMAGTIIVE